jgi:hypothetical protein
LAVPFKRNTQIGVFTGKNVDELSTETFNEKKRETFDKFRSGELHIAKLIGRVCGAKRPHSVSEQPIYIVSL